MPWRTESKTPKPAAAAGKPEKGRISVRAYHRGNHIYIEVEDDGRGIDYEGVRRHLIESGSVSPVAAAELSDRELREFLFRPGFSTASSTSELAGRGVGLDVVRANVHALNGEIEIHRKRAAARCFTLKSAAHADHFPGAVRPLRHFHLCIPAGGRGGDSPSPAQPISKTSAASFSPACATSSPKSSASIRQLALPPFEPINGYFHMVIVNVAGKHVGVVVEEVLGKDEIVIKNLGDYLRHVKLFPGTTIASDGSLILLVDLNRLVSAEAVERRAVSATSSAARVFAPGAEAIAAGSIPAEAVDPIQDERVVVVADDSISVRKFVGRMLEKAGFRVRLASDGLEASEIVAQSGCHLLITDLEMPRMNGYELMASLRQNPMTQRIPVLVVTSRAGAKHRDRAIKEGASGFLTKPVQEDQLIATVEELLDSKKSPARPAVSVPSPQD